MNYYAPDEIYHILLAIGSQGVTPYHGGYRGTCCIHGGDNPRALAVWVDRGGDFRATCHSHHCISAASIEWVVAKSLSVPIDQAVAWLCKELGRSDIEIPAVVRDQELQIAENAHEEFQLCDEAMLRRLLELYPHAPYWKDRGYPAELVTEFQLTYRSLDYRAVIPIFDEHNAFVGLVSRATRDEEPKYKWESPNSTKTRWLYGMPQAFKRPLIIEGRRAVFLVEGTLDLMKPAYCGFPTVSSQTNKLSISQANQLITNWDLVLVVPDQDEAGRSLVVDVEKLCSPFMDMAVVTLPKGFKDVDEIPIPQVSDTFQTLIAEWRQSWQHANRFQRSRPINLNLSR